MSNPSFRELMQDAAVVCLDQLGAPATLTRVDGSVVEGFCALVERRRGVLGHVNQQSIEITMPTPVVTEVKHGDRLNVEGEGVFRVEAVLNKDGQTIRVSARV